MLAEQREDDSTLALRSRIWALRGTECAPRRHSILVYSPLDEPPELWAVVLHLCLESGNAHLSRESAIVRSRADNSNLTRRDVTVLRGLRCERKRSLPNRLHGFPNLERKPGQSGRVALRELQDGHVRSTAADGVHCIVPNGMKLERNKWAIYGVESGVRRRTRLFICASHMLFTIYSNQRDAERPDPP